MKMVVHDFFFIFSVQNRELKDRGLGSGFINATPTLDCKEIPYFAPEVAKQSPWPFEISSWKDTELELIVDLPCTQM